MPRIEPNQWWPDRFARAECLRDVLRLPNPAYASLAPAEQDLLRQTQLEAGEVVRLLGESDGHYLVLKTDGVLGWIPIRFLEPVASLEEGIRSFVPPGPPAGGRLGPLEFCEAWKGTRYLWGGVTRAGIDCSAFTQRYYRDVLGRLIPRNSVEQRRAGRSKTPGAFADHDLVFCRRKGRSGVHHVGVFYRGGVWHARLDLGVVREELANFLKSYDVEEIVSY